MAKYRTLAITILVVVAITTFAVKQGLLKRDQTVPEPLIPVSEESEEAEEPEKKEGDTVVDDDSTLTVDPVLEEVSSIVKWQGDQYSRGIILWNTKDEELKLEGVGYLMGAVIGDTDLKEKHSEIKIYLRDRGFEHDKYNVGSSGPGSERSILKLNNIGCELYIRDDERKGGTDMGILCTELPEEVLADTPEPMSEKRARSIAETSECVDDGVLKGNAFYNQNSKTWWLDLDIDKEGCNPACVVSEDETVEINWRCTGVIAP